MLRSWLKGILLAAAFSLCGGLEYILFTEFGWRRALLASLFLGAFAGASLIAFAYRSPQTIWKRREQRRKQQTPLRKGRDA